MDVLRSASLARQFSVPLTTREHFWGMPKRGLALLLANVMFWQPLWAQADGIAVSGPSTTLGQAGNGVPIVNIAAPNGSGLSHNQFSDYNVGQQGVILNNSTNRTQSTQLGGIILGNPNLKGNAANIILNEVTGGSPSQLRGYTEVAGQSAKVIVANPYGISCNGCGFINTPNVTLTTGKPVLDNGRLDHYQVDGGAISIDGQGLNASNVGSFEIITRAAQVNAQINANQLTVVAGRNDVNAQTLATTTRADDGSTKPLLAIDSSALGGMYAGAIRLVGTEAGVGVKLDGTMAASGGDIQLDVNGHLSLAQAAASGAVTVKAVSADLQGPVYGGSTLAVNTQGDLNSRKTLAARDTITLTSGGQLTNNGIIESGVNADNTRNNTGDVQVTTQTLTNTGNSIIASRTLNISATGTVNNQGGTLSAKQAATLTANSLDNQNKGRVLSTGNLDVTVNQVLNAQGGLITSSGPLTATLGELNNRSGEISSLDAATITVATLDNVAGLVTAGSALKFSASGGINNRRGEISSSQSLNLVGRALDNSQGKLISNDALTLNGTNLINQGGLISGLQGVSVTGTDLDNRNSGTVSSRYGNVDVEVSNALQNSGSGALVSQKDLTVTAASLDNSDKGIVSSGGGQTLTISDVLINSQGGLIDSGADLDLNAHTLNNTAGVINAQRTLTLTGTSLDNTQGSLASNGSVTLDLLDALTNTHGLLSSGGDFLLKRSTQVNNQDGQLASQGLLTLLIGGLDNRNSGTVAANDTLTLTATGAVLNGDDGLITSKNADLILKSDSLDNAKAKPH
ncbi:filamentous hemagglutinin [Pseudomonas lurida]|uniref:two-partner secretion domain-containing protein n=1 Tax=Pseudomonas lurida TaxID=244566 RepID=UPI000C00303E|nr:filamentous hemagglutinin [Pseudomonas lurida]